MIYTKFKALSKISKVKYPEIVKEVGVEKSIFINCCGKIGKTHKLRVDTLGSCRAIMNGDVSVRNA